MEDKDSVKNEKDTLDLSLEEKETTEEKKEERTVPLQALQEERKKRQELEARLSALEESASKPSTSDKKDSNPDIEQAVAQLDPYLRQKGYLTREQLEEEKQAETYANEMKELTKKFDGKDGRPAFDAYEVSEFGKKNRIFNLEVAYKTLHEKELIDWQMKQGDSSSEAPETEKSGSSGIKQTGNSSILTRDSLKLRLAKPDGKEWWEKNRDKVFAAMQKGEIS